MQIKQSSLLPLKKVMGRGCGGTLPSSPATVLPERANPGGVHPTRQKSALLCLARAHPASLRAEISIRILDGY